MTPGKALGAEEKYGPVPALEQLSVQRGNLVSEQMSIMHLAKWSVLGLESYDGCFSLPGTSYVTSYKVDGLPEPQFPHLKDEVINSVTPG